MRGKKRRLHVNIRMENNKNRKAGGVGVGMKVATPTSIHSEAVETIVGRFFFCYKILESRDDSFSAITQVA
jgi:hypothetical protein